MTEPMEHATIMKNGLKKAVRRKNAMELLTKASYFDEVTEREKDNRAPARP